MTPRREITSSSSSCPLKPRFSLKFLKTLMKIKKSKPPPSSPSSPSVIRRRAQRIKLAAYSSMARAVGSRKGWSRALILKLRARKTTRGSISAIRSNRRWLGKRQKRSAVVTRRFTTKEKLLPEKESGSRVPELRRLVPGGESMELYSLLEETAHFVRCLETQVKVMRSIADHFSC